ncbi:hypothetical protein [Thermopirellula anaerolimosa]
MKDYNRIATEALKGASKGALLASAASIVSGVAMATVPIKVLGIVTVATATTVAAPVVGAIAVGGAVVGGAGAAYAAYRKQAKIEKQFREATSE